MEFLSTGTIGVKPSVLSLSLVNGFNQLASASTGTSQDLNSDGNKDIGGTTAGGSGWPIFGQTNNSTYAMGSGACATTDRTNILLGVVGYTFNNATTGASATVTLAPRAYALTAYFYYEADGVTHNDKFTGTQSNDFSIGTAPVITFSPQVSGTPALSLGSALTYSNVLINGVSPLTYTVTNTGNADLTQWTLTPGATGTINVSPLSGTLVSANNGTAQATGTYTAPGTAGPDTITGSVGSSQNGVTNNPATSTPIAVNVGLAAANPGGDHAATATFNPATRSTAKWPPGTTTPTWLPSSTAGPATSAPWRRSSAARTTPAQP